MRLNHTPMTVVSFENNLDQEKLIADFLVFLCTNEGIHDRNQF